MGCCCYVALVARLALHSNSVREHGFGLVKEEYGMLGDKFTESTDKQLIWETSMHCDRLQSKDALSY